jgi:hypothetical protein
MRWPYGRVKCESCGTIVLSLHSEDLNDKSKLKYIGDHKNYDPDENVYEYFDDTLGPNEE